MARLYLALFLVQIALAVLALISCLSTEEDEIRALPRIAWVLIILFFPLIGSIAWFLAGRTSGPLGQTATSAPTGRPPRPTRPRRPRAPDDDPEFLASLQRDQQEQAQRDDSELFRRWEEDLRKREEEQRRKERSPDEERPES